MAQNIFEELQVKKQRLVELAEKAVNFGWITQERYMEMVNKISSDVLTIGVIGQVKCGKSTFLNSFVFGRNVLPAAITPMTAALSVITYGEKEKIVAEFYNCNEWEEQKIMAARNLDEVQGNNLEKSKIKAAKELMEQSVKLGSSIQEYLGKTQEDELRNLEKYVGVDGEFVSITKSVTIYCPEEYLKDVELIDTPGFNDPIVSREERTKDFLRKADVIILMLYAGRPFDATDRDILFKNVRQCGIGKVIIGVNKYDIPYENGETEKEIIDYVANEVKKASQTCGDDTLCDILQDVIPIPLSAEMALLSELPMQVVSSNETYKHAWDRMCALFEISSQPQMREKSYIDQMISAIKGMLALEKGKILFSKPLNAILASGQEKRFNIEREMGEQERLMGNLNLSDNEIEDKKISLAKACKRIKKQINNLEEDLNSLFRNTVRIGTERLEDDVDTSCDKMRAIVDSWSMFNIRNHSVNTQLKKEYQHLITRTLKRNVSNICNGVERKISESVRDFLDETQEIFFKYVPDFEFNDTLKSIEKKVKIDIKDNLFRFNTKNTKVDLDKTIDVFINYVLNRYSSVMCVAATNSLFLDLYSKESFYERINFINVSFDAEKFLAPIINYRYIIINIVTQSLIDELLNPMLDQIQEIIEKTKSKDELLAEAKVKLEELNNAKTVIEQQISEMNIIGQSL